jgi:hypothetical protein
MCTDRQPRQRLQLNYFECLQIVGTVQDSQNIEVIQRDDDQDCGLDQEEKNIDNDKEKCKKWMPLMQDN